MLNKRWVYAILICAVVFVGTLVPILILTAPQGEDELWPDWWEAFEWMDENLTSNTLIASWKDYGDYINAYSNCTPLDFSNSTVVGLMGRLFMAVNESEAIEILNQWGANYILVTWSYLYPNSDGDEFKYPAMIQSAYEELQGTKWEITVGARWNETSSKPTCEFFNTTLWGMLTYGEPFIDYSLEPSLVDYLIMQGYPLGYFEAQLNWADPWVPGSQPEQGQWKDDSGHLWKYHNPPLGQGMVDDGLVDMDGVGDDDTVGRFENLNNFTLEFISSAHCIKIFKIN